MGKKADEKNEKPHAAEDEAPSKLTAGERRQSIREAECNGYVSHSLALVRGIRVESPNVKQCIRHAGRWQAAMAVVRNRPAWRIH